MLDTDYKHYTAFCMEVPKDDVQKYYVCQYMSEYGRQEAWRRVRGVVSPDNQQGGGMGQQFTRPSSTKGMSCYVMSWQPREGSAAMLGFQSFQLHHHSSTEGDPQTGGRWSPT